uniref:Uncharacterized protein n=1 Tax=Acrobeloides nanus TaxID=290746 RepID=A0A914DK32_9BILA
MGNCQSQDEKELADKTKNIDRELMQQHLAQQKVVKLLLLGAGECGKSTVLKQMRILHDHGFSEEEMLKQKSVVFNNTVQAMVYLLRGMNQLNIQFDNPSLESEARIVLDVVKRGEDSEPISQDLARALRTLWADKGVNERALAKGPEFQFPESAPQNPRKSTLVDNTISPLTSAISTLVAVVGNISNDCNAFPTSEIGFPAASVA